MNINNPELLYKAIETIETLRGILNNIQAQNPNHQIYNNDWGYITTDQVLESIRDDLKDIRLLMPKDEGKCYIINDVDDKLDQLRVSLNA